jgi:hypothetical protein
MPPAPHREIPKHEKKEVLSYYCDKKAEKWTARSKMYLFGPTATIERVVAEEV